MLQREKWKRHPGDQLPARPDRQVTVLTKEGARYRAGLYELCGRLIRNGDIVVEGNHQDGPDQGRQRWKEGMPGHRPRQRIRLRHFRGAVRRGMLGL